jgi:hypothetical protein
MQKLVLFGGSLLLLLAGAACSGVAVTGGPAPAGSADGGPPAPRGPAATGTDYFFPPDGGVTTEPAGSRKGSPASGGVADTAAGAPSVTAGPTFGAAAPGDSPPVVPSTASTAPGSTTGGGGVHGPTCAQPPCAAPAGQLTAGEWNDLDHWSFFLEMLGKQPENGGPVWGAAQARWGFAPTTRLPVVVKAGSTPVPNAAVELRGPRGEVVWRAVTSSNGEAQLFTGLFSAATGPFQVHVAGPSPVDVAVAAGAGPDAPVAVAVPSPPAQDPALDLMFVVDTTGSMGDELSYIKSELEDVVSRVEAHENVDVRLGLTFYRDLEDEYVVRAFPFTTDLGQTVTNIAGQSAGGGGDGPEAVDYGLQIAVDQHDWNPRARARLLVLVLDAPPHETAAVLERYRAAIASAAAKGITIIPVGASGIDKGTELLLRFSAIATNGTYAFLTDDSGIGNPHLDPAPTIGPFDVELLNDLLVRVIESRL